MTILTLLAIASAAFVWTRLNGSSRSDGAEAQATSASQASTGATTAPSNSSFDPLASDLSESDPAVVSLVQTTRAQVRANQNSGPAWGQLGMVYMAHGLTEFATASFARAIALEEKNLQWHYLYGRCQRGINPDKAIASLRRAAELAGDEYDAPVLYYAEVLIEYERLDEARKVLDAFLARSPLNARAQLAAGRLMHGLGEFKEAFAHLERAAANPAVQKDAYHLMAQAQQRLGDSEQAEFYRQQSQKAPGVSWPDPHYQAVGKLQVGLKPMLSKADRLFGQNRVDEALSILLEASAQYPKSDWAWTHLGRAHMRKRQYLESEHALKTAVELAPGSIEAQFYLGVTYSHQKKYAQAASCFQAAIQHKPDFGMAHFNLGLAFNHLGDVPAAIKAWQMSVQCQPEHFESHMALAEALVHQGRAAEARVHIQKAVELRPGDQAARRRLTEVSSLPK